MSIQVKDDNSVDSSRKISIRFFTGSVVVPATGETIETSCPVNVLTKELFPTFLRPNTPMFLTILKVIIM